MKNYICVYDFETDGINPHTCQPVQLAACMIHPITLDIVDKSEFCSYMKPEGSDEPTYYDSVKDTIAWHANNYNPGYKFFKKDKKEEASQKIFETWKNAPNQKQVWFDFHTYLLKYNKNQSNRSRFSAPVRAGMNIRNFDNIIADRLCSKYKLTVGDEGEQKLFQPRDVIDIKEIAFYWFESLEEPKSYNMDELRKFFGLSAEGAHDALKDIRDEAAIIQRFLKLHRLFARKVKFKGSMKNNGHPG